MRDSTSDNNIEVEIEVLSSPKTIKQNKLIINSAVNHVVKKFNVRYELKQVQTSASKKQAARGGRTKAPLPALQRAPVAEPDSSDEEEAALLALAEHGR